MTYRVIAGITFSINGGYIYVDSTNVLFRGDHFNGAAATSNTGALVQGGLSGGHIRVETSTFDGGLQQNRGVQSDTAHLYVYSSYFTRTGNAAVEKNDRAQQSDLVIANSTVAGIQGWPSDQHVDGFQVGGANVVTIVGNTITIPSRNTDGSPANSCLGLWAELGNTGTTRVEGNIMRGCGGSSMYLEAKAPYSWTSTVTVRNNRFDHGSIWYVLAPLGLPPQLVWEGNVWDETGTTITLAEATTPK